jgi:uncharacterized protein YjbJ (UPF0337 family)
VVSTRAFTTAGFFVGPESRAFKATGSKFVGKVKEDWGKLTDDDLDAINGTRDRLKEGEKAAHRAQMESGTRRTRLLLRPRRGLPSRRIKARW